MGGNRRKQGEIEENVSMLEHYDGQGKLLCDILESGRKFDVDCQGQKGLRGMCAEGY